MKELSMQQLSKVSGGHEDACHCPNGTEVEVGTDGVRISTNNPGVLGQTIYDTWAGTVDATSRIGEDSGIFPAIQSASDAIGSAHDRAVDRVSRWIEAATTSFFQVRP